LRTFYSGWPRTLILPLHSALPSSFKLQKVKNFLSNPSKNPFHL
jgi:hypothetical protein